MRRWVSGLALVAGLASAQPALADSPAAVYSDFAEDGVLTCGHSRSALNGALSDASLHQYGDPLTFIQLKLAIRRQLATGCRRRIASRSDASSGESSSAAQGSTDPGASTRSRTTTRPHGSGSDQSTRDAARSLEEPAANDSKQSGGMVLVGVGLLLLTLASGGWAARRAFGERE
jgi:cobalamin biosynthesis Mg chelatase CobN